MTIFWDKIKKKTRLKKIRKIAFKWVSQSINQSIKNNYFKAHIS